MALRDELPRLLQQGAVALVACDAAVAADPSSGSMQPAWLYGPTVSGPINVGVGTAV